MKPAEVFLLTFSQASNSENEELGPMLRVLTIIMQRTHWESKSSRCDRLTWDSSHKGGMTRPVLESTNGIDPSLKSVQKSLEL